MKTIVITPNTIFSDKSFFVVVGQRWVGVAVDELRMKLRSLLSWVGIVADKFG